MSNIINIDSKDFVKVTNKLEKIGRSDLPIAVRSTLNNAAFRMKGYKGRTGQIEIQAKKDFDYSRSRNLFRFMTGVSKANGFDIARMQSESGIIKRSGRTKLAEGLADQQKGGETKSKTTPLDPSRIGKNIGKRVRPAKKLSKVGNAINIGRQRGKRFVQLSLRAIKTGRSILITGRGGFRYIAEVLGFKRNRGDIKFKLKFLYRVNDSGTVNLRKKRPFVNRAAVTVSKQMPRLFEKEAKKRITKSFKK